MDYRHTRSLGTHKEARNSAPSPSREAARAAPRPRSGRDIFATVLPQCNVPPFPAPGPRSGHKREREARAHGADSGRSPLWHFCNSVSTIQQPRSGAQPMREHAHNLCAYNAGAPATICRIDISRSVDLDSWIVDKYLFIYWLDNVYGIIYYNK